jgi:hypothetical protein
MRKTIKSNDKVREGQEEGMCIVHEKKRNRKEKED